MEQCLLSVHSCSPSQEIPVVMQFKSAAAASSSLQNSTTGPYPEPPQSSSQIHNLFFL